MKFAFTGKDPGGRTRANIERMVAQAGWQMTSQARHADCLVASRIDTQKAREAVEYEIRIVDYVDFVIMYSGRTQRHETRGRITDVTRRDGGRLAAVETIRRRKSKPEPEPARHGRLLDF